MRKSAAAEAETAWRVEVPGLCDLRLWRHWRFLQHRKPGLQWYCRPSLQPGRSARECDSRIGRYRYELWRRIRCFAPGGESGPVTGECAGRGSEAALYRTDSARPL